MSPLNVENGILYAYHCLLKRQQSHIFALAQRILSLVLYEILLRKYYTCQKLGQVVQTKHK